MAPRFDILNWKALSADYAKNHATKGNQRMHFLGIPMIVLSLIAWTQWPQGSPLSLLVVILPLFFLWEIRLGAMMSLVFVVFGQIALRLAPWTVWALFIGGWVLQLLGHKVYEKKSPAFAKNLIHLLVGPAWILEKTYRKLF